MFALQIRAGIDTARRTADLDTIGRGLWGGLAAGMLSEEEAAGLSDVLEARRQDLRQSIGEGSLPSSEKLAVNAPKRPTLFARAKAQTPPDRRRSIERRRRLAASGPLPPQLAAAFTTSELAVLRIISDEVRAHGVCSRTVAELAARAGTAETTVRNVVRLAVRLRLLDKRERPRPGRKHLANLLTIASKAWRAWIDRRPPSRWAPSTGCKILKSTGTKIQKGAFRDPGPASGNGEHIAAKRRALRESEGRTDA